MYREEPKFTRLTLESPNEKIVYELPHEDVSGEDMMQAIATIMFGMTFPVGAIYHSMADYLAEHAEDEYEVNRIYPTEEKEEDDTD